MRTNKIELVRKMLEANPKIKAAEVMKKLGIAKAYTYVLMSKARKMDNKIKYSLPSVDELKKQIAERAWQPPAMAPMPDPVNRPAHYTTGGIETIDFIEAKKLGYNLGNVVKYITRADHKGNKLEDLRKAQWYLSREIATLK
jgi:predicted DNA-binding transcriptional regulator AlpA